MIRHPHTFTLFPYRALSRSYTDYLYLARRFGVKAHAFPDRVIVGEALACQLFADDSDSRGALRSEEHTSELQSRQYVVSRLLLEKTGQRYHRFRHLRSCGFL